MPWKLPVPRFRNGSDGNQRTRSNKLMDVCAALLACLYLRDPISQNSESLERPSLVLVGELALEEAA